MVRLSTKQVQVPPVVSHLPAANHALPSASTEYGFSPPPFKLWCSPTPSAISSKIPPSVDKRQSPPATFFKSSLQSAQQQSQANQHRNPNVEINNKRKNPFSGSTQEPAIRKRRVTYSLEKEKEKKKDAAPHGLDFVGSEGTYSGGQNGGIPHGFGKFIAPGCEFEGKVLGGDLYRGTIIYTNMEAAPENFKISLPSYFGKNPVVSFKGWFEFGRPQKGIVELADGTIVELADGRLL